MPKAKQHSDMENFIPLEFEIRRPDEMRRRAEDLYTLLNKRRTVREFSPEPIPLEVVREAIRTAGTAPSGAHKQPWFFCLVHDPEVKRRIREGAEHEERLNYSGRMSEEWLEDLLPFGTNADKEFLEIAPALIVVFKQVYRMGENGKRLKNYYVNESVGLAAGMLIAALHNAGLATLTHTPSPMKFLNAILERPANETPVLLIPVGFPASEAAVPNLSRKPLDQIMREY